MMTRDTIAAARACAAVAAVLLGAYIHGRYAGDHAFLCYWLAVVCGLTAWQLIPWRTIREWMGEDLA